MATRAGIRHTLSSHQPLDWLLSVVIYAALVARRRFPIGTVAVAVIGSVVLMADGTVYPLTVPALFCALYLIALAATQCRALAGE